MTRPIGHRLELGELGDITTYQAAALQAAAYRALRLHVDKILSPYGITKTQWLVLGLALDAGTSGVRFADAARLLDIKPANLTRLIRTLEKKQMLTLRTAGTGRGQKTIFIHPSFPPEAPEIEHSLRVALRQSIYASITPLEFRMYLKVLYKLSRIETP